MKQAHSINVILYQMGGWASCWEQELNYWRLWYQTVGVCIWMQGLCAASQRYFLTKVLRINLHS